jgi:hypothetical protein
MKNEIKPLWIGLAAVGAIILLVVLYKAFLAEPPMPSGVSREEEMKHKGMNATTYSNSYKQQYSAPRPGGGMQGGMPPGGPGGYGRPSGYGGQGGYGGAPR